jgi:hypothetical protein
VSSSAAFWAVLHFTTLRLIYDVWVISLKH